MQQNIDHQDDPYQLSIDDFYERHYALIMQAQSVFITAFESLKFANAEYLSLHFPGNYVYSFELHRSMGTEEFLKHTAERIVKTLVGCAETRFGLPGCKLQISSAIYHDDVGNLYQKKSMASFSPKKVWSDLVKRYGNQKGHDESLRQLAKKLIDSFSLHAGKEIQMKCGLIVICKTIWLDDFEKKQNRRNILSYNSNESVLTALNALADYGNHQNDFILVNEIRGIADRIMGRRFGFVVVSREKISLSQDITMVMHLSKIEFRFTPAFFEKFNVFLSTYGFS